jgi:hypothetical protein
MVPRLLANVHTAPRHEPVQRLLLLQTVMWDISSPFQAVGEHFVT